MLILFFRTKFLLCSLFKASVSLTEFMKNKTRESFNESEAIGKPIHLS